MAQSSLGQPSLGQFARELPVVELSAGMYLIKAEVASTEEQQRRGLMHRRSMGQNEGMLFVYPVPVGLCMWMKNTNIPLSVAFIDGSGKIVNIEDMQPHTTTNHCGKGSVRFALEMNRGWFRDKNILPGSRISGLERWRK
ncbi:MAG: DUF192 domain-containing protein [Oxalobacter sp.]|nr:MAG: DUF192 domain-containing protein [Oxalobacter sp.]